MLSLLRGAKRRGWAWLYLHLLLWAALAATGDGGETCRSGAPAGGSQGGAFRCPQASDGADGRFCCGTCSAPHCCASEAARLDQAQCPAAPPTGSITTAPPPGTTPASPHPHVIGITVTLVFMLAFLAIICGICLCYARSWWRFRNQDQENVPLLPDILSECDPSTFDHPPSDGADQPLPCSPPPYSEVCPHGPGTSSPASNIPPVARLAHATAGYQGDGAQPGLPHPSEPILEMGSFTPSQACAASSVPAPSDDESRGPRPSAWAGLVDAARYSNASTVPCDDPPPYSIEDPYGFPALATTQAILLDFSPYQACSASDDPPPYSIEDPYGFQPLAATQAALLDSSPSQACVSSPSSSEAEASHGVPGQHPASVECGPPTCSSASASDDPPPYSIDDPNGCQAPAATQAALPDSSPSQACVSSPSSSEAEASRGVPGQHPASVECGPPTCSSASASDDPPPYSIDDPNGFQAPAATQAAPPDSSPSQACVSSPVLSLSEYEALGARPRTSASVGRGPRSTDEESRGTRPRRSASAGRGPPRYNPASSLDCDGRTPYCAEDPPDSQAPAALQGKPPIRLDFNTDLSDAPPGRSAMASPPVSPEDPPPCSVAFGPERRARPRALAGPPAVQLQPENPGAAEDEETLVFPPDLLDIARGGPLLEPMAEADELDVPPLEL